MSDAQDASIDHIAKLYERHDDRTGWVQRTANQVTMVLGRPISLVVIFGLAIFWVAGNYVTRLLGSTALEEFPFPDLGFVATIAALLVALLILTTQRHEEELAERRTQLALQIAMLSERKIAKIIELLEEQRRDNPQLPSRRDREAESMARPADHEATLEMIDEAADQRRTSPDGALDE